jgi:hypothetical protein
VAVRACAGKPYLTSARTPGRHNSMCGLAKAQQARTDAAAYTIGGAGAGV